MNKKEAAEYLGISTRSVENAVAAQKLSVRYEKGKTGDQAVFDEAELRRYKADLDGRRAPRATVERISHESAEGEPRSLVRLSDVQPISELALALKSLSESLQTQEIGKQITINLADKLMLSLAEASVLANVSKGHLREAIGAGKLKAKIIGRGWRIKRDDLEGYVKKL
jgi:excisionase family DNA binding protein